MNGRRIIREYHGQSYANEHSYINGIDTFLKKYNLPEFTQEDPMNSPTSFKEVGYQIFSSQEKNYRLIIRMSICAKIINKISKLTPTMCKNNDGQNK